MTRVLLIDDEGEALLSLSRALKSYEPAFIIEGVGTAERALDAVKAQDPQVVILDLSLDSSKGVEVGFDLLLSIVSLSRRSRVIVLTGHSSTENGVRALNLGAAHFLEKPPDVLHLVALIKDAARQSELFRTYEQNSRGTQNALIEQELLGDSKAIITLREEILFAASNNQAVLLAGESGTGKTLCASLIHRLGNAPSGRFVCYTPGFNNADIINSDLFGHVKGSFTGALENRRGLLPEADGGTFFLDEVDELPTETQIVLLRVIQSKTYRALGSSREEQSNFRLISATNRALQDLLKNGKIREDFYHRIAHRVIHVPALRERRSDLKLLSESFLESLSKREGVQVFSMDSAGIEKIEDYDWPGNVRELQSIVEGAAYLAQFRGRNVVKCEDIRFATTAAANLDQSLYGNFHDLVERYKHQLVVDAMQKSGGNQVQAAKALGLDRSSLRRILGKE